VTYAESRYRRGLAIFDSTRGWAGIIIVPVPVPVPVPVADQDESANPPWRLQGQLLGESTTPRQPEDVEALATQASHHGSDPRGQPGDGVRQWWCGAASHSGNVEPHHPAPRVERVNERLKGLEARAHPVAQQERWLGCQFSPGATYRDTNREPPHPEYAHRIRAVVPSTGHCSGATP
jgi:hypothetical protein